MKRFAWILLFLAGCCSHQDPEVVGGSPESLDIYDPNTDAIYCFDVKTWKLINKRPNWNHWWNQERNQ